MVDHLSDKSEGSKKTLKSIDPISHFPTVFQNDHHAYCARKSERLATAIHVVTSFVSREEPIRALLRSAALDLVRLSIDRSRLVDMGPETYATRCAEVAAILSTAESAGLVSSMNAKLIVDEYARLADFVKERYAFIRMQVTDIQDFIGSIGQQDNKGHRGQQTYRTKDTQAIKDIAHTSGRRADILALFGSKDRISIKDAVHAVVGVSEKTLQRDLLALVAEGVLIKEGERRWSLYRKAPQHQ